MKILHPAGRILLYTLILLLSTGYLYAQLPYTVELQQDDNGWQLLVDSEPFPIHGVVWAFNPIGENFNYNIWDQPEDFIRKVVDREANLLVDMGVNTIRTFSDIPPRWVEYLYLRYGIYTIINNLFGRFGISVNAKWYPNTDYSMPETREKILREALEAVEMYRDTAGVLMFFYGNENNYGLEWESTAIENLPVGRRLETRARFLYSLYEEAIVEAKKLTDLPVGIVNGDTQYLAIIAEETPSLDIFGANIYRGMESGDLFFESVKTLLDVPVVYTEFGADAFNVRTGLEDQYNQAAFLQSQWKEIYEQSYGKGKSQNMLGGFIFEWIDEWWKHGQTVGLYEHNTVGTWRNAAYFDGGTPINNMNEEWFGIIGQSELKRDGINVRLPRAAYFMMSDIWARDIYSITTEEIDSHFASIILENYLIHGESLSIRTQLNDIVQLNGSLSASFRSHFSNEIEDIQHEALNASHEEVATIEITATPLDKLTLQTTMRAQASALDIPLTNSYGYLVSRPTTDPAFGNIPASSRVVPRVPLEFYSGAFKFETDVLDIRGFYHDGIDDPGHADFYLEGDFFYLYPETFDIEGMDLGFSKAPFGIELSSKGPIEGFTVFAGPEIFWGSSPALYAKFYKELGDIFSLGVVHYEAFEAAQFTGTVQPTNSFPERKSSLYLNLDLPLGPLDLGIHAGALIAGTEYLAPERPEDMKLTDEELLRHSFATTNTDGSLGERQDLTIADTIGFKARVEALFDLNPVFNIYAEYTYAGLVAASRPFLPRGGSQITDSGAANRHEILAGAEVFIGDLVIAPKFRYRTPVQAPITSGDEARNPLRDPVYVHGGNRELLQAELVVTFDLTGATYFHEWNNYDRENALLAASLGFLWTIHQGPTDPLRELFGAPGRSGFYGWGPWPSGMAAQDSLWNLNARLVSNFAPGFRGLIRFDIGHTQNVGRPDTEPATYFAGTLDLKLDKLQLTFGLSHNAFGPENWHANQNIRAPLEWNALLAYHLGVFSLVESPAANRIGMQFRGRSFEDATPEARTALNTLGDEEDEYRMEITFFYELSF